MRGDCKIEVLDFVVLEVDMIHLLGQQNQKSEVLDGMDEVFLVFSRDLR